MAVGFIGAGIFSVPIWKDKRVQALFINNTMRGENDKTC